ncbi:MAG: type III polyketide synthase [Phycisphaeraceae bacterium]
MTRTADHHAAAPPATAPAAVRLTGLGTAQPASTIDQPTAAALADARCCGTEGESRWLRRIYRGSAVDRRASVLLNGGTGDADGQREAFYPPRTGPGDAGPGVARRMGAYAAHALPLAVEAAGRALAQAGEAPGRVGQVITVSCTGFAAPGLDVRLIEALGMRPGVGRTVVGFMGCHGAINGLRVARALAAAQPGVPVLLCAVELCSLHFQYGFDRQRIVANALFADGAAACVLQADAAGDDDAQSASSAAGWRVIDTASHLVPDSHDAMTWTIGDHGFCMTLSPRVPELIEAHLRPWLAEWLAGHGLAVADVGQWAVHPGGPRVLDATAAGLGLPGEALTVSRAVLAECGNMSSPTVLFILDRLRREGGAGPCVMLAFGPGLVAEAALLTPA